MSKISRTVRGEEEVARNVRKGCRTLDEEEEEEIIKSCLLHVIILKC
jgi:hypothetical protein